MAFGTAKSVLFIEVSSFQGVLIRGVPLYVRWSLLKYHLYVCLISSSGDGRADHDIVDGLMAVIWSFGQVHPDYFHSPASGIESGTAQNDRFYQPDELKYHGTRNRGATSVNFFG